MTRQDIEKEVRRIFLVEFEVENPEMDVNLREAYGFDSIDAIALLEHVEDIIAAPLTQAEKKEAMEIRTINQICDFIDGIMEKRNKSR